MARSSHGSRRALPWAGAQAPRRAPPRVVRLGRAANDNTRPASLPAHLLAVAVAAGLAVFLYPWLLS